MYFKTVILLVDIRFISLPKVIKKIKCTSRKASFYKKCRILKTLPCIEKLGYGFEGRIYLNHFPKQKRKSDVSFRSWIPLCKNKLPGFHSRHPDRYRRLTPNHCRRRRMLAHRTGTINTDLICYLLMSPSSASATVMGVPEFFVVLLRGWWIVASTEQMEFAGSDWGKLHQLPPILGVGKAGSGGQNVIEADPGPLFTKLTPSYGYMDPHDKPKTVRRPS